MVLNDCTLFVHLLYKRLFGHCANPSSRLPFLVRQELSTANENTISICCLHGRLVEKGLLESEYDTITLVRRLLVNMDFTIDHRHNTVPEL